MDPQENLVSLEIGADAPDFTLLDSSRQERRLRDYAGKKLVLYFYPRDDTVGCTKEAIEFNVLRQNFAAGDVAVLGVSPDSPESHKKFAAKHELEIALGVDETKRIFFSYGVWGEKSMYGRKYWGVLRTTFLIDATQKITKIWHNVRVPGHAKAVLEAARKL